MGLAGLLPTGPRRYHDLVNYLAHLFLARPSEGLLVGAIAADFVRGRLESLPFAPDVLAGIRLHRLIDAYTDSHPLPRRSRDRFGAERRRYAGIIVDLLYDHFLARHWDRFSPQPLPSFCSATYRLLLDHRGALPTPLITLLPRIAGEDWLGAYRHYRNVAPALERIGRRLKRGNGLLGVERELRAVYDDVERDFLGFFPELMDAVARWRADGSLGFDAEPPPWTGQTAPSC